MSRHTTQTRSGYIHQLAALGLGLGLAGSLVASTSVDAATPGDDAYEEFTQAIYKYFDHLNSINGNQGVGFSYPDSANIQQLAEIRAWAEMVRTASEIAIEQINTARSITNQGTAAQQSGRQIALQSIRQSAINAATAAHTITITLINSITKLATAIPVWIDPTILAPGYYSQVPQNEYGAIVSGNGAGYGNALVIELAPSAGYGETYGADYGYGWDAGLGGDYYSVEDGTSSNADSSASSASASPSSGGSASAADSCPTTSGEYSFETIEQACGCPAVDYWYTTETSEDGETTTTDSGSCSELFDGAQSCVPPWRDWYTLVQLADGRQIGVPDMLYMIPADDIRSELFDALPTMIASMEDGGIITMHYAEAWTIGQNVVSGAPITSTLQLQTEALDGVDQALGLDGVLVGYACSANPAALGGTMSPSLLEGEFGLMDEDGIVEDCASVQAAIIGAAAQ